MYPDSDVKVTRMRDLPILVYVPCHIRIEDPYYVHWLTRVPCMRYLPMLCAMTVTLGLPVWGNTMSMTGALVMAWSCPCMYQVNTRSGRFSSPTKTKFKNWHIKSLQRCCKASFTLRNCECESDIANKWIWLISVVRIKQRKTPKKIVCVHFRNQCELTLVSKTPLQGAPSWADTPFIRAF